jgi:hypothetical protein
MGVTKESGGYLVFAILLLAGCGVLSWQTYENRKLTKRSADSNKMEHTQKYEMFLTFAILSGVFSGIFFCIAAYMMRK